jgi:MarR family
VQGRVADVLRPMQLGFARQELLMLLTFTRRGALPMAKAGARLQVHPASVSNTAGRLEAAGYVVRRPSPVDGRAVLVEIIDAGRSVAVPGTRSVFVSGRPLTWYGSSLATARSTLLRQIRGDRDSPLTTHLDGSGG